VNVTKDGAIWEELRVLEVKSANDSSHPASPYTEASLKLNELEMSQVVR
jgi:hypothetical protein